MQLGGTCFSVPFKAWFSKILRSVESDSFYFSFSHFLHTKNGDSTEFVWQWAHYSCSIIYLQMTICSSVILLISYLNCVYAASPLLGAGTGRGRSVSDKFRESHSLICPPFPSPLVWELCVVFCSLKLSFSVLFHLLKPYEPISGKKKITP